MFGAHVFQSPCLEKEREWKIVWMLEQDRKTWGTMPLSAQREPCQVKAREGRYLKEERHLIVSFTHTPSRPSVHSDTDRQFPEVLLWWIKIRGHAALFSTTQLSFSNSYASFLTMAPSISIFLHFIHLMKTTFSLWLISFFTSTFSLCLTFFDRNFLWFYLFKQSLPHIRSFPSHISTAYWTVIAAVSIWIGETEYQTESETWERKREWNDVTAQKWMANITGSPPHMSSTLSSSSGQSVFLMCSTNLCFHYSHDANNGKALKSYFVLSWSQFRVNVILKCNITEVILCIFT